MRKSFISNSSVKYLWDIVVLIFISDSDKFSVQVLEVTTGKPYFFIKI